MTCPTYRYRPAIVAEASASLALLSPGRVFLGTGTGEALNEKAAGGGWGHSKERAARRVEAVELIRKLWSGETITASQHRSQSAYRGHPGPASRGGDACVYPLATAGSAALHRFFRQQGAAPPALIRC